MRFQGSIVSSIGALFGVGTSDFGEKFVRLKQEKYGYYQDISYEIGSKFSGSDYDISKLYIRTGLNVEFKNRNIIAFNFSGADAFYSPFYDQINSTELLSRGDYSREFRGDRAFALSAHFIQYLFKKRKTGFVVLCPFVESAFVYKEQKQFYMSGIGLACSYTFWKFPFPLGLKYTYDSSDGSYQISALFGGSF
jgi:hypothetical protein